MRVVEGLGAPVGQRAHVGGEGAGPPVAGGAAMAAKDEFELEQEREGSRQQKEIRGGGRARGGDRRRRSSRRHAGGHGGRGQARVGEGALEAEESDGHRPRTGGGGARAGVPPAANGGETAILGDSGGAEEATQSINVALCSLDCVA